MKPPLFRYEAPRSIDEVLSLLRDHGDDAKLLAGGQSLMPLLNFRLARPGVIIDLNLVTELDYMNEENGQVVLGAMVRQRIVETSDWIKGAMAALPEVLKYVGHVTIRNRGTVGGSLAHADPAAELPMLAAAFRADLVVTEMGATRVVPAKEFFLGPLTSVLGPTEVLREVRIPRVPDGTGIAIEELAQRSGDFAIVAALAAVHCDPDGTCDGVWIGVSGAHMTPITAIEAEQIMVGEKPTSEIITAAADVVASKADPQNDVHASASYRRDMVRVYTQRALTKAISRQRQVGND